MNTVELLKILRSDSILNEQMVGVFACDKIPRKSHKNACFISNTQTSTEPGEHWVCFYTNDENVFTYFDSYGRNPFENENFKRFLKTAKSFIANNTRCQGDLSSCCGQYCIFYLALRSRNFTHSEIMDCLHNNYNENDRFVTEWVNENFDLDLPTLDVEFVVSQICRSLA